MYLEVQILPLQTDSSTTNDFILSDLAFLYWLVLVYCASSASTVFSLRTQNSLIHISDKILQLSKNIYNTYRKNIDWLINQAHKLKLP